MVRPPSPCSGTRYLKLIIPSLTVVERFSSMIESRRNTSDGHSNSPHNINFTLAEVHISSPGSNLGLNSQSTTPPLPPLPAPPFKLEPFRRPSGPPIKLPTPAERAQARIEAEREKELETSLAIQQEEERQARRKAEKEESRKREEEEEARRKAKIEQEIRIAQLLRQKREHDQAKADEKFAQEVEERRRAHKEKRTQENYRSQAWRIDQERSKEQTLHQKEEEKKRREEEKKQERKRLFHVMKAEHPGRFELSGWMSVQPPGNLTWRRRWFTFDEETLKFFKNQTVRSYLYAFYQLMDFS